MVRNDDGDGRMLLNWEGDYGPLVEHSPDVVARYRPDLALVYINSAIEALAGRPREHYLGKRPDELDLPPEVNDSLTSAIEGVLETGTVKTIDFRVVQDGKTRYYQCRLVPEFGGDGDVEFVLTVTREFTALKQAQLECEWLLEELALATRRLQTQTEQLRSMLDNLAEGVAVRDVKGNIVFRNRAAGDITGVDNIDSPSELVTIYYPDGRLVPHREAPHARLLEGYDVADEEYVFRRPDGVERHVLLNGRLVNNQDGSPALTVLSFRDITDLRRLEQAERTLLHVISHDLRSPLAVIQAHAQLLETRAGAVDVQRTARTITIAARRINAMVGDLGDTARLEAGGLQLLQQPIDLRTFVYELLERVQGVIAVDRVTVDANEDLPLVFADPNRLERILLNLLSNALKYSPASSEVTIRLYLQDGRVITAIQDTGAGIEPDEIPHIFHQYYRSAQARQRGEGLGLGLYITRGLIEAHGGDIWVDTKPGEGSTFYFSLPVERDGGTATHGPDTPRVATWA